MFPSRAAGVFSRFQASLVENLVKNFLIEFGHPPCPDNVLLFIIILQEKQKSK